LQTRERFAEVMAPKVQGAWNLHLLTKERALDFFVMFSSAASLLGSPGQGNYAAANSFMDALAHMRRSDGLPGLSINWGPWGESGMAADLARRSSRQWTPQGVTQLSTRQGLRVLDHLLASRAAQVCVMPVDWAEFIKQFPAGSKLKVLEDVAGGARPGESEAAAGEPELLRLLGAAPPNERRDLLVTHLQREVANVLGLDESETVEPEQGFFEMGLDSLMAVELKNYLGASLGQFLPSTLTFQYPNIAAMSDYLLGDVLVFGNGNGAAAVAAGREDVRLEGVSEDELLSLLADELSRIDERRNGGHGGER
jgi:acyl carrier protein